MNDYYIEGEGLEIAIADAERRVGQFILSGGEADSDYVKRQKDLILEWYKRLEEE